MSRKRLIVGITGASGVIYGIRLLETLRMMDDVESHLILSQAACLTITAETKMKPGGVIKLADYSYHPSEIGAKIASGSFQTIGMIVAPCSMKTLSAIAHGYEDNLIVRAANVVMKECRKLVLMPRETPLSAIYLENMLKLSKLGVSICPPVASFYHNPESIDDMINYSVMRVLDLFSLGGNDDAKRWQGIVKNK